MTHLADLLPPRPQVGELSLSSGGSESGWVVVEPSRPLLQPASSKSARATRRRFVVDDEPADLTGLYGSGAARSNDEPVGY
jgi:hypothetical protein